MVIPALGHTPRPRAHIPPSPTLRGLRGLRASPLFYAKSPFVSPFPRSPFMSTHYTPSHSPARKDELRAVLRKYGLSSDLETLWTTSLRSPDAKRPKSEVERRARLHVNLAALKTLALC